MRIRKRNKAVISVTMSAETHDQIRELCRQYGYYQVDLIDYLLKKALREFDPKEIKGVKNHEEEYYP